MGLDIGLIALALLAGVLTVFAPCIFTFLPILLSGAAGTSSRRRVLIIISSTAISIFVFTLLLRASTALLGIPETTWEIISGSIILLFGIFTIIPELWNYTSVKIGFSIASQQSLGNARNHQGLLGDVLLGASLGPVFTSCSPFYFLILGTILPTSFATGIVYLLIYILGLGGMLLTISLAGHGLIKRLGWAVNPEGVFKRVIGILFIILGWSIMFGLHKDFQTYIVENVPALNVSRFEEQFIPNL